MTGDHRGQNSHRVGLPAALDLHASDPRLAGCSCLLIGSHPPSSANVRGSPKRRSGLRIRCAVCTPVDVGGVGGNAARALVMRRSSLAWLTITDLTLAHRADLLVCGLSGVNLRTNSGS